MVVSIDSDILTVLINDGNTIIKILATVLRSLHDKIDRIVSRVFSLENVFFGISTYIKEIAELRCIVRKSDERSFQIVRSFKTMLWTIWSDSTECTGIDNNPSFLFKTGCRVYTESNFCLITQKKHRI